MNRITLILAAVVAVGLAFGAGGWMGHVSGVSDEKARNVAALLKAEQDNAAETKRLIRDVSEVAENDQKEREDLQERLAGADDAIVSLQHAVSRANTRANTAATAVADAARARTLLAQCAEEYRDLGRTADDLRATVLGLRAYGRTVSTTQSNNVPLVSTE